MTTGWQSRCCKTCAKARSSLLTAPTTPMPCETWSKKKRAWANVPAKRKESFPFSAWVYRQRNLIERFFNKLKQFRGIATRYDKDPRNFLAAIKLVATRIWIRSL